MSVAAPQLKSLFHLPPSVVNQTELISSIVSSLKTYSIVFIRGAPLMGKSTVITQLGHDLEQRQYVHLVDFRAEIELSSALYRIANSLGLASLSLNDDLALEDAILKYLEENRALLLIDNIDQIQGGEAFLEFLIRNLRAGAVVATGIDVPKIDPLMLLDFRVITLEGLTTSEVSQMIEKSNIRIESPSRSDFISRLRLLARGNPFLIKLAISPGIIEGRPLVDADIEKNILAAQQTFYINIFNSLTAEAKDLLLMCSLIQHSRSLESDIVEKLRAKERGRLSQVGFILSEPEKFSLSSGAQKFLREIALQSETSFRMQLVKLIEDNSSFDDLKEKLFQSQILKNFAGSTQIFDLIALELTKRGEGQHLIEWGKPILDNISHASFVEFIRAQNTRYKYKEIINDCSRRMKLTQGVKEQLEIKLWIARAHYYLGDYAVANHQLENISNQSEGHLEILITAQGLRAKTLSFFNFEKAQKVISESEPLLKSVDLSPGTLGDFHADVGRAYYNNGDYEANYQHFQIALECFRKAGRRLSEIFILSNSVNSLIDGGNFELGRKQINECLELTSRYGLKGQHRTLTIHLARSYYIEGQHRKALKLLEDYALNKTSEVLQGVDFNYLKMDIVWLNVMNQNFVRAINVQRELLQTEGLMRQQNDSYQLIELNRIAQLGLENKFQQLSERPKNWKSERVSWENRIWLENIRLELNWKNSFIAGLTPYLENPSEMESEKLISVSNRMMYLCLSALHQVFEGQIVSGERKLSTCLNFFHENCLFIWEFRSLIGLTIIDLVRARTEEAQLKINQAKGLISKFESDEERFILDLLEIIVATIKSPGRTSFESSYSRKWVYAFLRILNGSPLSEHDTESNSLLSHERTFLEKLVSLVGIKSATKIRVRTRHLDKVYYPSELPSLKSFGANLIIDTNRGIITVGQKNISVSGKDVLVNLLEVLIRHSEHAFTKEELTKEVWQETYNPLVHDTRIYTSILRLRKLLGRVDWIDSENGLYQISSKCNFLITSSINETKILTDHQQWILRYLEKKQAIDRSTLQELKNLGKTTAKNELKALANLGRIQMIGQGKSSRYILV